MAVARAPRVLIGLLLALALARAAAADLRLRPLNFEPYLCRTPDAANCDRDPVNIVFVGTRGLDGVVAHVFHHLPEWEEDPVCNTRALPLLFRQHGTTRRAARQMFDNSIDCGLLFRGHLRIAPQARGSAPFFNYALAAVHFDVLSCQGHVAAGYDLARKKIAEGMATSPAPGDGHVHRVVYRQIGNSARVTQPCFPDPRGDGRIAVISIAPVIRPDR